MKIAMCNFNQIYYLAKIVINIAYFVDKPVKIIELHQTRHPVDFNLFFFWL